MWIKSENSDNMMPLKFERSGNNVILRKNFKLIPSTDSIGEHYEYDEWQMTSEQYEIYQHYEQMRVEQDDALIELAELLLAR